MPNKNKYLAFISYRHADNRHKGRLWATWLHQAIETYEVPADLVGKKNGRGEIIPERIYPIFRDEDELPADADLGRAITNALDSSELLVVLCSPRAVASTYVAEEIDYFKRQGHSDRIIAAIIDGEPNTSWDKDKLANGFTIEDECFPIPLQFEYDDNNEPSEKRAEPIAADFRVNNQGVLEQSWTSVDAYKQHLKRTLDIDKFKLQIKLDEFKQQQNLMLLKIIAGVLAVPLGELTQRDKEYQLAQARLKAKKLRRWLTGVAMLAVVAVGAGILAYFKQVEATVAKQQAVVEKKNAENNLAQAYAGYGRQNLDDKQYEEALTFFLNAKKLDKNSITGNEEYHTNAKVMEKSWSEQLGIKFDNLPSVSAGGNYAIGRRGDQALLFDLKSNQLLHQYRLPTAGSYLLMISNDGSNIFEYGLEQQSVRRLDWKNLKIDEFDFLVEEKMIYFLPDQTGDRLLLFTTEGGYKLVELSSKKVIQSVTSESIGEVDPGYLERLKTGWLASFEAIKVSFHQDKWSLVYENGLTIIFEARSKANSVVKILPPLYKERALKLNVSQDGKLIAAVQSRYCYFQIEDSEERDWMRIADTIDIWDVQTRQKVNHISLNWPSDISALTSDPACGDDVSYNDVLSGEKRSQAGAINNQLNRLESLIINSKNDVDINWNGQLLDSRELISSHKYYHRGSREYASSLIGQSEDSAILLQKPELGLLSSNRLTDSFWLYKVKNKLPHRVSDVVVMTTSFDHRFVSLLSSNGLLQHRFVATGDIVKSTITDSSKHAKQMCRTDDSHELLLVSSNKIWRYNWLSEKVIWEFVLPEFEANIFSCSSNLKTKESAFVFLNYANPWRIDSVESDADFSMSDSESRILRLGFDGTVIQSIGIDGTPLAYPVSLNYSKLTNEVLISTIGGNTVRYNLERKMVGEVLRPNDYTTATSVVSSDDFQTVYVGYSDGTIYQHNNQKSTMIADLPLSVIAMDVGGNQLFVDTGIDPIFYDQINVLAKIGSAELKSYSYQIDLASMLVEKAKGYGSTLLKFSEYLFENKEKIRYSNSGELTHSKPSGLEPIVLGEPGGLGEILLPLKNENVLSVSKKRGYWLLADPNSNRSLKLAIDTNRKSGYIMSSGRKWLIVFVENSDLNFDSYLISTNRLEKAATFKGENADIEMAQELVSFSANDSKVVSCDGLECKIYELSQSKVDAKLMASINIGEEVSRVRFLKDKLILTTVSGKLQLWTKVEEKDSGLSNFVLEEEKRDRYYKNVIYDDVADRVLITGRRNSFILSANLLTTEQVIERRLSTTPILYADIGSDWLLALKGNATVMPRAQLIKISTGSTLVDIPLDASAILSLYHDRKKNKLLWSGINGQIKYWDIGRVLAFSQRDAEKEEQQKIDELIALTGKDLVGVEIQSNKVNQSARIINSFGVNSFENYHTWQAKENQWIGPNRWPTSAEQLVDPNDWQQTHRLKRNSETMILADTQAKIELLETKIMQSIATPNDSIGLVQELKLLKRDHPLVKYSELLMLINQNSFSAYLLGNQLLHELTSTDDPKNAILIGRTAGLTTQAAVLAMKFQEAFGLYEKYPMMLIPPQFIKQLMMRLTSSGFYLQADFVVTSELEKLSKMGFDQPENPGHVSYQSLLRFQSMARNMLNLRAMQSELPRLCLTDIKPNSGVEMSEWQSGDCLVSINGEKIIDSVKIWRALINANTQPNDELKILRNGNVIKIKAPGAMDGGGWNMLGYNGYNAVRVKTVKSGSVAEQLGILSGDYLVAMNNQWLASPHELSHYLRNESSHKENNINQLQIFRASDNERLMTKNSLFQNSLFEHPLAYRNGKLMTVEIPKTSSLGLAIEPVLVFGRK